MHGIVCYLYLFYLWVLPGMGFLAQHSLFGYSWI